MEKVDWDRPAVPLLPRNSDLFVNQAWPIVYKT